MGTATQVRSTGYKRRMLLAALSFPILLVVTGGGFHALHLWRIEKAEEDWSNRPRVSISNFGNTTALRVLPLVNWHSARSDLATEAGVSYLIQTDAHTILFDMGHNARAEDPSPLLRNMKSLGIDLAQVDTIFISHPHFDHVGGRKWEQAGTFSLGNAQIPLSGRQVYAPLPLTYPGLDVHTITVPTVLFPGVASLGPIPRQLFMGRVDEQALVVNVKDKGLVIFSGCGHQRLPRILERVKETFSGNMYGIIGDLHYPVPSGRIQILGLNVQRVFASGKGPFQPVAQADIEQDIALVREIRPGIVSIGGHDSSDETIARFAREFGAAYRHSRTGEWIVLP